MRGNMRGGERGRGGRGGQDGAAAAEACGSMQQGGLGAVVGVERAQWKGGIQALVCVCVSLLWRHRAWARQEGCNSLVMCIKLCSTPVDVSVVFVCFRVG